MARDRLTNTWRALRGRPPVLTLAMMSRVSEEVEAFPPWDPQGHPYGGVVDTVLTTLVRAGLIEKEPGYFGGVRPALLPGDAPDFHPYARQIAERWQEGVRP